MKRSTRKWIIALALIPVVAYGVARLAVWYSVKDTLDGVRETLSPVASLEHTKIVSPVFGPFGATGIRIQPHIFDNGISIGSALFNIPDPIEKYRFISATLNHTLPQSSNVSLNQVQIPLDGGMAEWFDRQAAPSVPPAGSPAACTAGGGLTVKDMRAMGYEELVADVMLDYSYDRRAGGLVTYVNISLRDMFDITLEGKIPPGEVVFAVDRMTQVPRLSDLSITVSDATWSSRFNRYCASAMGITEGEYVEQNISEMRQMLTAVGFEPSEELMAGLRRFADGSAPLTLSLNPRDPVQPTALPVNDDLEVVIDRLGLEILIDGKPIQNLGAVVEVAPESEEGEQWQDETYKPTPVRELALYLKSRIKIFTEDGKVHEGYLDSIDAGKVVVTRHLVGGSATFDVSREEISEVLVLRP